MKQQCGYENILAVTSVKQSRKQELSVVEQSEQVGGLHAFVHVHMFMHPARVFVHVDVFVYGSQRCTSAKERDMPCWQSAQD